MKRIHIDRAMEMIENRSGAMNEAEAKRFIGAYGIPVVEEVVVQTPEAAISAAENIGFPVVVKGFGKNLLHKTEKRLVRLNLADSAAVQQAVEAIMTEAGADLEGVLVQPQIAGSRELVAGMFRDPQFGPVVMLGIGGVLTEALKDVCFALAPLDRTVARNMFERVRAASIFEEFRGEKAADKESITDVLLALSRIALDCPRIKEIDINPFKITPQGAVVAVDALAIIEDPLPEKVEFQPVDPHAMGSFFYPRSIAFVGASSQFGKWGHMLFTITSSGGFRGDIFLVNPKGGTIGNRKVYRSVSEIPSTVDLAVVTIPAAAVIPLIPELAEKNIRKMLLITSGFGETGPEGKALESRLTDEARQAGILILGPNTMGICNPHIDLYCTGSHVRPAPGDTVVVAQSGNMGTQLLAFAEKQGIGVRAFCGSGNESMITIEDFMDAFEVDELTHIVMLYVESVKNGRRFYESAKRVGRKKPIVLLKGGRSKAGHRAAASHTGAMTTDTKVFDAVCRQAGIVQVAQPMDLLDLSAAFSSLPLPKGNRAAVMTLGGGWGVVTADLCSDYGIQLPELEDALIRRFDQILPAYWSRSNPVDIVGERDPEIPLSVMEALIEWEGCDAVINLGILGRGILLNRLSDSVMKSDPTYDRDLLVQTKKMMTTFERQYIAHLAKLMETYRKPILGVSLLPDENDRTVFPVEGSRYKGVFYPTPERAVKAFSKMVEYARFLSQ